MPNLSTSKYKYCNHHHKIYDRHTLVNFGGEEFVANNEAIPLLKALNEADKQHGNRDGLTSIHEIAAYVDEQVPDITFKAFGYEQIPQVFMIGRDFPIGVSGGVKMY